MDFFENLKEKIKDTVQDMSTVEHAMLREKAKRQKFMAYRYQEATGDSICLITDQQPLTPEELRLFNSAFQASIVSRTGITQFLIETIT